MVRIWFANPKYLPGVVVNTLRWLADCKLAASLFEKQENINTLFRLEDCPSRRLFERNNWLEDQSWDLNFRLTKILEHLEDAYLDGIEF